MPNDNALPPTPSQEAREVGAALKRLREIRELTQDQAAERYGVTRTAWQNYESGRAIVLRTDMQAKLASALGATRADLLALLTDSRHSAAPHSHGGLGEAGVIYSGPGRQQAIFPLAEGDVIISYPANLSPAGRDELSQYLALFLKRPGN